MPYRTLAPEQKQPGEPRWPALVGTARAVRYAGVAVVNPATWRYAWWGTRVMVALVLLPFTLILHGLRNLGGAKRGRRDAASFVARVGDLNEPLLPIIALLIVCGYMVGIASFIASCVAR